MFLCEDVAMSGGLFTLLLLLGIMLAVICYFFQVMVGYALQRRLKDAPLTISSLNPGFVSSK